jgi:hypothetical protein
MNGRRESRDVAGPGGLRKPMPDPTSGKRQDSELCGAAGDAPQLYIYPGVTMLPHRPRQITREPALALS